MRGTFTPKACTSVGFSVAARRYAPSLVRPVVGQEHEAQVLNALQALGDRVRQARRAELVLEGAFDDEREAEGEQQPVEVVEPVQAREHEPLDHHAQRAHHDGHDGEGPPVTQAELVQQEIGHERAQHVLGAGKGARRTSR